jgi:hypothetical protein
MGNYMYYFNVFVCGMVLVLLLCIIFDYKKIFFKKIYNKAVFFNIPIIFIIKLLLKLFRR